ncbi:unnamed protein product [Orchesella dallaii]|uniref:Multidrug resistance-associated protein 5 n=1 Tax=Orchesella dallaii TaxID=48710 RepID=A0ABP1R9V5_9HEXA
MEKDKPPSNKLDDPQVIIVQKGGSLGNGAGTGGGDMPDGVVNRAKYAGALKTLLPYRSSPSKKKNVLPSSKSGLFSFVTVSWLSVLMWKAFRQGLTASDLWELKDVDKAEPNAKRLNRLWNEEKLQAGKQASLVKAVWRFGKTRFYVCIFLMIFSVIFQFLGPAWILKAILSFTADLSQPLEVGLMLAFLAFMAQLIRNLSFNGLWMMGIHTGMRIEGALQLMTYEKMLRLRHGGDKVLSKAITFCTNDQERIAECVSGGVMAFAAPVMFIMCIIYTTLVLGPWALLGNLVFFLFYPIIGTVGRYIGIRRRGTVKATNQRVGLMTEILNSIRLIKMYGWENSFSSKIKGIRRNEEDLLKNVAFLQSLTATLTPMVNILASVLTFVGFSLGGNNLNAAQAFTIFSVFAAMQFTIGTLPFAMRSIAEAVVCLKNFQKYLELPEFDGDMDENIECNHDSVIAIQDGSFAWENESEDEPDAASNPQPRRQKRKKQTDNGLAPTEGEVEVLNGSVRKPAELTDCLRSIQLEVKRGSLVGICGSVGSGKSSLLSAILGDMIKTNGKMLIRGSLAVVTQEAWIYGDSLQENILFGSPLNTEKYQKVIDVCCLRQDLDKLPHKDLTLIGERGVNLSGGQKARVNLARAVYADKSIYLLDDPMAAVDTIVAKTIFESCIRNYLADKTVLLATHSVQFLEACDEILVIKDGAIVEKGVHAALMDKKDYYYNFLQFHHQEKEKGNDELPNRDANSENQARKLSDTTSPRKKSKATEELENMMQKLTEDDSNYKFAGIRSYIIYMKSAGGYFFAFGVFFAFLAFVLSQIFTKIWLQYWIDAGDGLYETRKVNATENNFTMTENEFRGYVNDNPDLLLYLTTLLLSVLLSYVIGMGKGFLSTRLVLWGSSHLHGRMFDRVIRSPMAFFDRTPSGKILNRFSKDMDELDARMPFFVEFVVQSGLFVIASFLVVCFVYPVFSAALLCILAVMIFLDVWLNYGVRETKRLEIILKTPVIHHLQSSMGGLSIIRTFSRQDNFKIRFSNYLNRHLSAESVYRFATRWFTVRIEFLGLFTIVGTILLAVFFRGEVSSAMVGLALASIYTVCTFVPFVLRMKSELQARFISVERILEYSEEIEQEESDDAVLVEPPEKWPQAGKIEFERVNLRYKDGSPLVFNDVSFTIQPNEKIGIVGRTGAGKTSVLSTLLRLYPIENGKIAIDGVDISQISLQNLRSSVAVIPQDPVLFQGTVRYNIDPFEEYSDNEIWSVLESSQLKHCIERDERRLFAPVSANGDNFSLGEKQLICLCRAMLRKNKILLLDEATASLDIETDFKIQNIIRDAFSACTVITIAHRLNTVANYDRIMVMDSGKVIEFDSPEKLMKQENSMFKKMVEASGITLTNVQNTQSQEIPVAPTNNDTCASNTEESDDK